MAACSKLCHAYQLLLIVRIYRRVKERQRGRNRTLYMKPINTVRPRQSLYKLMFAVMKNVDIVWFRQCFRTTTAEYDYIVTKLTPLLRHPATHRCPLTVEERVSIAMRYYTTGQTTNELATQYYCAPSTVSKIISEVSKSIIQQLGPEFLPKPTSDSLKKNASAFNLRWNYPRCVGALDGKHIHIKCPDNSGSHFFNYKGRFSIVLLAIVDADYRFVFASVGEPGRYSDGGIFERSSFGKQLSDIMPADVYDPGCGQMMPYVLVADEAFGLNRNCMRPFSAAAIKSTGVTLRRREAMRIYNYRQARARRTVENAFGILVHRWRCLRAEMEFQPSVAQLITMAVIVLHNFLTKKKTRVHIHNQLLIEKIPTALLNRENGVAIPLITGCKVGEATTAHEKRYESETSLVNILPMLELCPGRLR